jgi:hypothetical protein
LSEARIKLTIPEPREGKRRGERVFLAHGSHPYITDDRRIEAAIRHIPTTVRKTKIRDTAMLARGADNHGNFDLLANPVADFDDATRAVHADVTQHLAAALYSGTDKTEPRA